MQIKINQSHRCQPGEQDAGYRLEWEDHPLERSGVELINILRWEDDGGLIMKVDGSSVILGSDHLPLVDKCHP